MRNDINKLGLSCGKLIQAYASYPLAFGKLAYGWIIIASASADASADLSADMPENRLIKLKIILKHSRML